MKHAGWAKHKKKGGGGDAPTITEMEEEVDMELPSVPSSPKRAKASKMMKELKEPRANDIPPAAARIEPATRMAVPALPAAPAAWMDNAPPDWNCSDAIAAALERVDGNNIVNNKRQHSSRCSLEEASDAGAIDDGAAGSSWPIVEEPAPWDDYCQSNGSCSDDQNELGENVIDLVSPSSPLKNNGGSGGGEGGGGYCQ